MATETHNTEETKQEISENLLIGLSMLGGSGIVLMVIAAGIGVVVADVDSGLVGLIVLIGAALLVAGIGGWVIAVRPYEHFDDINVPMDTGHHHHEEEHDEEDEHSH
ncbi:MAG: hypothetical protein KC496_04140 [Anaerolineae bacterium]|nr:hypothetical protein [Anaerolineae bacterium]